MARPPKPRWHSGNQLWISDVGEPYTDKQGRPRRRTVSFPDIPKKDPGRAKKALEAYLEARAEREEQRTDPTVETLSELYLEWLEANREPATVRAVTGLLSKFAAWPIVGGTFRARRVSTFRAEDLEHMLADMGARHAPTYCAVMHGAVQALLNWSSRWVRGREPAVLIFSNPFAGVPKPKVGRSPGLYASRDELAAFLRWAWRKGARGGRDAIEARFNCQLCLLLRMLAHTAARPGELTSSERAERRGLPSGSRGTNGIRPRTPTDLGSGWG